ncbi:MAG: hypothetical protein ISQ07_12430 [Pirellulales bacterium]|nr:hypothetical protein [Pirellulales bacterium]
MTGLLAIFRQTGSFSCIVSAVTLMSLLAGSGSAFAGPADTATAERIEALGKAASCEVDEASGQVTAISVTDGSSLTANDVALFASLPGLTSLKILNCREFNDDMAASLTELDDLTVLAITNSGITDTGVQLLADAFPNLTELDLSSNTNLTGTAMRAICSLEKLERLTLLQNRFNDLHCRRLSGLPELRALDLRGNMEVGDMTLRVVGKLPKLSGFKHRSTVVSDGGIAGLANSPSLRAILMQDFAVSSTCGEDLARLENLTSLEIFRCQGFGDSGVLSLEGMPQLDRLTLRDLPEVSDAAIPTLATMPKLRRLYLHELTSVSDEGLASLADAKELAVLDIWSLPRMTDASAAVIASLPKLKELSIRETGMSAEALEAILGIESLETLVFKNGDVPADLADKVKANRKWRKLDLGQ